ncbi:hypothetical protein SCHPADRAFT_251617 [Schizopora paradoxa]|uniref:Translationally-controlled tumor protein homolog n=1 Tax=Schizopora paradoxa TaxID=27342 RepID=A0A0H2S1M4_9AGAM|nr:hypothetical protein SCHPADRAFT_251617 [Schizopora paradoxa]
MLLYTDVLTDDELITDAFDLKLVDDIVYEVDAKWINFKEGDIDIGANPSAEEQEESVESSEQRVINVVHSNRLQSTTFDKKSYLSYLKEYMKNLADKLPDDRKDAFKTQASAYAKKIVANFKDFEFYTGENMNPEGMVILLNYRKEDDTPYFIFWKDGLKEVKL